MTISEKKKIKMRLQALGFSKSMQFVLRLTSLMDVELTGATIHTVAMILQLFPVATKPRLSSR
jgi:hypothetical protein